MDFKFQVAIKILKPVAEVFDGVVNPKKLSGYFTKSATPMVEGGDAMWSFPEFSGEYPVTIRKIVPNQLIALEWMATEGGYNTQVEIAFESHDKDSTIVRISESGWKQSPQGLKDSYGNCQGWMNMACCLKAYLEYGGINLRKGAFDFEGAGPDA